MTAEEVRALPIGQKLQLMEAIWEDLRAQFERLDVPEELGKLLDQRRARVRDGSAQLLDWDEVKSTLGKQ
ncbi:MAG TPA: addiction module protein [Verrucomicrobiae bacterium]|nr:addiction module protein [Verrucomicrobiae bacterium]